MPMLTKEEKNISTWGVLFLDVFNKPGKEHKCVIKAAQTLFYVKYIIKLP